MFVLCNKNMQTGRLTEGMLDGGSGVRVRCSTGPLDQTGWLGMDRRELVLLNSRGLG
jgi:hypothetical protein